MLGMREIDEFEKGGWCGVEIQAEEHSQRCWNHQPAPALVPQCWERILQEFCVLSLPQFSIADFIEIFNYRVCCGVFWLLSLSVPVFYLQPQAVCEVTKTSEQGDVFCFLGRGGFQCGLRIPRRPLRSSSQSIH